MDKLAGIEINGVPARKATIRLLFSEGIDYEFELRKEMLPKKIVTILLALVTHIIKWTNFEKENK